MKSYLVGGALRDEMLGLPVSDRDWVVVGGTPDEMLAQGYRAVGKDFPVFLHPETHDEYALARIERKTAPGYHGFAFITDATVTLEEDLSRRDLTINAMARHENGELVDPYGGKQDLEKRVLRHVSTAFIEDPVRVLRVARFMSRLACLGFTVAEETQALMQQMVHDDEVNNLVAERVWQEMQGALSAKNPSAFFETLRQCGALAVVLPEVDALYGIPQSEKWHPEIDSGLHTMMVLDQCTQLTQDPGARFAALCHDLGKATTPKEQLPSHEGHEERGALITEQLCRRLRIPGKSRDLAVVSARYHTHCHRASELDAESLCTLLQALDVARKPDRFQLFLKVCLADTRGRLGFEQADYPQSDYLNKAASVYVAVDAATIARNTANKQEIPEAIHRARVQALQQGLSIP